MRGSLGLGLVIGLIVGAGGMFLVLRFVGGDHGTAPADAAVVASAPTDGGVGKTKHKGGHGHRPRGGGNNGATVPGGNDDQAWANQGDEETDVGPAPVTLTAADVAMEWRGDDVSPPPRKIDMNSNDRPLEQNEISDTIHGQGGGVETCVKQSAPNARLTAEITIKMVVDGKGNVSRSKINAPHILFEKGLLPCAQGVVKRMHFPATGMPTLVTMPVSLT